MNFISWDAWTHGYCTVQSEADRNQRMVWNQLARETLASPVDIIPFWAWEFFLSWNELAPLLSVLRTWQHAICRCLLHFRIRSCWGWHGMNYLGQLQIRWCINSCSKPDYWGSTKSSSCGKRSCQNVEKQNRDSCNRPHFLPWSW